jgi:hypothetical protein
MTLIEHYVRYHAIRVVLGLGLLLVLAFLAFKRLAKHDDHDGVRKSDRLD